MSIKPYYPPNSISQLPRGNYLTYSNTLANGAWSKFNCSVSDNSAADPLGGSAATTVTRIATGNMYYAQGVTAAQEGVQYTFSIWIKLGTLTGAIDIIIEDGAGGSFQGAFQPVTTAWQRFSITGVVPVGASTPLQVELNPQNATGSAGDSYYVYGAQLEPGNAPGVSIITTSSPDLGIWGGVGGAPVFPYLPGQNIAVTKSPAWSTEVIKTASGRSRRTAYWAYPLWNFEVSYEVLRKTGAPSKPAIDELLLLWEFFNVQAGQFGEWLLVDPTDCQVLSSAPAAFAIGDGVTTQFQLVRYINSFVEPVAAVYSPTVLDNGSGAGSYSIADGVVTFSTAPAAGHVLSWYGYFYFLCVFSQDDLTFEQIVNALWSGKSLKIEQVRN